MMTEAEQFIQILCKHSSFKTTPATNAFVDRTWRHWEQSNITRPAEALEIQENLTHIVDGYYKELLKAAKLQENSPILFYGSIASLQAYAKSFPDKSRVIVIDSKLDSFLIEFITACVFCACTNPNDADLAKYKSLFELLILRLHHQETPAATRHTFEFYENLVKSDYDLALIGAVYSSAIMSFILAHELAHHILGHTESFSFSEKPTTATVTQDIVLSHEEEYQADELATQLMGQLIQDKENWLGGDRKALSVLPLIFNILHYAKQHTSNSEVESLTHPSPENRKRRINDTLSSFDFSSQELQINDAIEEVLVFFSSGISPTDQRLRKKSGEILL